MTIACRMNKTNFRTEYFNAETGKRLFWKAKKDAYSYSPPFEHKQFVNPSSMIKAGETMPYDNMKYGYCERDFELIEA